MSIKKKIPCRVCGKLFEPCSYCQTHSDIFRWRNFACSRECAVKYINDTIAYRESQKQQASKSEVTEISESNLESFTKKITTTKRKSNRKTSTEVIESEIKNSGTD